MGTPKLLQSDAPPSRWSDLVAVILQRVVSDIIEAVLGRSGCPGRPPAPMAPALFSVDGLAAAAASTASPEGLPGHWQSKPQQHLIPISRGDERASGWHL